MKYKIILFVLASVFITGCGDTPLFTEMNTHRLKIVIKGTFESDGVSNFVKMTTTDPDDTATIQDDSVTEVPDSSSLTVPDGVDSTIAKDVLPTKFMIDIAEIRVDGKKISNFRQVFSIPLDDNDPFFNGTGIELETDDPHDGNYNSVQVYIRKLGFDNAKVYKLTGNTFAYEKEREVIFYEKTVPGFDFNQLMVNSYWDSLRIESGEIIRSFPLQIPIIGGMQYSKKNDETTLEIRFVIKNYIKKYEYGYYEDGVYKILHYYALSDWLRDVKTDESDIGGNLHAVAASYVSGKTGSITVNNPSGGYVVAIPASEAESNLGNYYITDTGANLRGAVGNSDLPVAPTYPGAYIEPVLDYYLKVEKYRDDWTTQVTNSSLDLATYTAAWDTYESAVHGDSTGAYVFGLKIPPYVAYGTSVTFSNIAPGSYNFYRVAQPGYGKLFLSTDFIPLNGGTAVIITEGINTAI